MSERSIADALFGTPPAAATAPKRTKRRRPEDAFVKAMTKTLHALGWTVEIARVDHRPGIRIGKTGEPDTRCIKAGRLFRIEAKRPNGGRIEETQIRWFQKHARNQPVAICDTVTGAIEAARRCLTGELESGSFMGIAGVTDLRGLR